MYEYEETLDDEDYETELYLKAQKAVIKHQCTILNEIEAENWLNNNVCSRLNYE